MSSKYSKEQVAQFAAEREQKLRTVATVADAVAAGLGQAEVWAQVLATAARFPNLSPVNCLVAAGMMAETGDDFTDLRSVAKWREAGRRVIKGERARVRLFAPMKRHKRAEGADPAAESTEYLAGWSTYVVFDVSQTAPMPKEEEGEVSPAEGSVPAGVAAGLLAQFTSAGGGEPVSALTGLALLEHPGGSLSGISGLAEIEAASAGYVAALMLGARDLSAPAPPVMLADVVSEERRGPMYDSVLHVITAGRELAVAAQLGTQLA